MLPVGGGVDVSVAIEKGVSKKEDGFTFYGIAEVVRSPERADLKAEEIKSPFSTKEEEASEGWTTC